MHFRSWVGDSYEGWGCWTYANPLRFGMSIVRRIYLEGAGLAEIWMEFIPLLVLAVITLPLAAWLFRHRLS